MTYKKIKSVSELKKLSMDEALDCFISIGGGMIRSSKSVLYDTESKTFSIINEIDDSEDIFTEQELRTGSNIGKAIKKGAFYKYGT